MSWLCPGCVPGGARLRSVIFFRAASSVLQTLVSSALMDQRVFIGCCTGLAHQSEQPNLGCVRDYVEDTASSLPLLSRIVIVGSTCRTTRQFLLRFIYFFHPSAQMMKPS